MPISPSSTAEPCVLVIFGASGDLTARKLIPALFELEERGQLPDRLTVLGCSRTQFTDDAFRARLRDFASEHDEGFDAANWDAFAQRIHYHAADASKPQGWPGLVERIRSLGKDRGILCAHGEPNVLFYLSVAPNLYEPIIEQVGASGLVSEGKRWCSLDSGATAWTRIIVEKPFGTDLQTAESLNRALGRVFEEDATYRIDHYLGKELVQNIAVLRFGNSIFEPLWNSRYIDHVQVTAAESLGVGSRAGTFFDHTGTVRDMIQSHLLQVLALVAIEAPSRIAAEALMREKIKLFGSAVEPDLANGSLPAVLGRYGPGGGEPGYAELEGVNPDAKTETFGAIKLHFENWRWAGVPFYLRSGKRMARKLSEVVVVFKKPPVDVFRRSGQESLADIEPNRLVIRFGPRDMLQMLVRGKVPGPGLHLDTAELDLDYKDRFGGEPIEAYGPLLLDAMRGDRTLYKHRDEVEGGWRVIDPILQSSRVRDAIETYEPGSWGPAGADELLARDGRAWHNPVH